MNEIECEDFWMCVTDYGSGGKFIDIRTEGIPCEETEVWLSPKQVDILIELLGGKPK